MEALKVKVSKTFLRQHDEIAEWYASQMGQKAMLKYLEDLESTIGMLVRFPQIGKLDERRTKGKREYYSFLLHPERLFIRYKSEAYPKGESIQTFCHRNNVPYNLFEKWYKDTRHKVVEVNVSGRPSGKLEGLC